jgi:hypothetical protein
MEHAFSETHQNYSRSNLYSLQSLHEEVHTERVFDVTYQLCS